MKIKETQLTEREGVSYVQLIVTEELHWLFREQNPSDYGIDAQLEIARDGKVTGKLIALQIKAGESYFKEKTCEGYIYRGNIEHLEYWLKHSLPVIIILYEPKKKQCLWQVVHKNHVKRTKKGWKLLVPEKQKFSLSSADHIEKIAEGPPYLLRLRGIQADKKWMQILKEEKELVLKVEEWVNKLSGKGTLKLIKTDGKEDEILTTWEIFGLGPVPYKKAIPQLFPWADISIDEEFYEDYDYNEWQQECGAWDSEENEYILYSEEYQEWKRRIPKSLRPYENDGEVAYWRLKMNLSDKGKFFLQMLAYLGL